MEPVQISKAWCVLFQNYLEVLRRGGSNDFNYPHTELRRRLNRAMTEETMNIPALVVGVTEAEYQAGLTLVAKHAAWIEKRNNDRSFTMEFDGEHEVMEELEAAIELPDEEGYESEEY